MAVHTDDILWKPSTAYKLVIKFSGLKDSDGISLGLSDYTVYMKSDYDPNKFIADLSIDMTDGDTDVIPLGITVSNTANLKVYDTSRALDIDYADSPYIGALIQGIKCYMYISDELNSNYQPGDDRYHVWKNYGTWYTVGFSGSFAEGGFDAVNIQLEDRINVLGTKEIKFEDNSALSFAGINVIELLENVFAAMGVTTNEYSIDSRLEGFTMQYGVVSGTLFRDFLNNVCQLMLARAIIGVDGVIRIEPALMSSGDEWVIEGQNEMSSETNANSLYNSVVVDYYDIKDCEYDRILTVNKDLKYDHTTISEYSGENVFSLQFNGSALAICGVQIYKNYYVSEDVPDTQGKVTDIKWAGWQSGITIQAYVDNDIEDATIKVDGIVATKEARESDKYLIDSGIQSEATMVYHFDTKQLMLKADADAYAARVAEYCKGMRNTKHMSGTVYSPFMSIGDRITIQNSGSAYNGTYRLTGISIQTGESYNLDMTLVKIADDEEE